MKRKTNLEEIRKQLQFGVLMAMMLDELNKHENDLKIVQSTISFILIELGFDEVESYAAAVSLCVTGLAELINTGEIVATLPALICSAVTMIDDKLIPDFVRDQVRETLAKH